ncbi:TPA: hypothetical protein ACGW3G_000913 [Stenotrophomonas maltophilia]
MKIKIIACAVVAVLAVGVLGLGIGAAVKSLNQMQSVYDRADQYTFPIPK